MNGAWAMRGVVALGQAAGYSRMDGANKEVGEESIEAGDRFPGTIDGCGDRTGTGGYWAVKRSEVEDDRWHWNRWIHCNSLG
jgi:hypothetical protein